jgi:undecaprenyl-diphosphatase
MTSNRLPAQPVLLAGMLVPLWLSMLLLGAGTVDRDILLGLYARDEPWLALAALGFTYLGNWWTVVGVTFAGALLLLYRGKNWGALTLLIVTFTGRALVILQKAHFARLRPEEDLRLVEVSYQSFPSGHAANPTIAYVGLALLLFDDPKQRRVAAIGAMALAMLIGISRPMLGVHWPSDVVGGWSFGLLWLALVFSVMERWRPSVRR